MVAAPRTVSGGEVEGAGGAEGGTAADVAHRGHRWQHHPGRTLEISGYTAIHMYIEDLFLRPAVKKAVILLLYRADVKVLKDALAHLCPYQTLTSARYSDPGGENTVPLPAPIQI